MQKTIITLLALASMATAETYSTETLWTMNFGSEYEGGYNIVNGSYSYTLTESWDVSNHVVEGGVTSATGHRPHLRGDTGVDWTDNFQFTITFTTPETIVANSNWPVIAGLEVDTLRFGPYIAEGQNNHVHIDGTHTGNAYYQVPLTSGTHTAVLTIIEGNVSLTLDGVLAATATIELEGDIKNITLGGGGGPSGDAYRMEQTVHSISMAKIVPEPTTATLSLLALAGLAARRRRK